MYLLASIFTFASLITLHLANGTPLDQPPPDPFSLSQYIYQLPPYRGPVVNTSPALFSSLEEFARIVSISYCVNDYEQITHPFSCGPRCDAFPNFELIQTWDTGDALSDSCGYIAIEHGYSESQGNTTGRIIVAFRGSATRPNWVADLDILPRKYVPYPIDLETNATEPLEEQKSEEKEPSIFRRGYNWALEHIPLVKPIVHFFQGNTDPKVASGNSNEADPTLDGKGECFDCTVHSGFYDTYMNTRAIVIKQLKELKTKYPDYDLHLTGHSLGGGVTPLIGLECVDRGWDPTVTTFGAPRIGNLEFDKYLAEKFCLGNGTVVTDPDSKFRRVTHVGDVVPHLPAKEWGYHTNAGEIFITKKESPITLADLRLCRGGEDPDCSHAMYDGKTDRAIWGLLMKVSNVIVSVANKIVEVSHNIVDWWKKLTSKDQDDVDSSTAKGLERRLDLIPDRFEGDEIAFAHRNYFIEIGYCKKK